MYTELQHNNELYHHGIKGQKWGVRRYQNADGSYTGAGRNRYGIDGNGRKSARGVNSNSKKPRQFTSNTNPEDMVAYKYNKPGESGWKGMARAAGAKIKPKATKQFTSNTNPEDMVAYKYNKPGESGWKGMARAAGAKIKPKATKQLSVSKRYSQRHSTAGIVIRQAGKSFLQGAGIGLAATPVYMLAGPAAPAVAVGASVVGGILSVNNLAKAGTSIGYKYGVDKAIKKAIKG